MHVLYMLRLQSLQPSHTDQTRAHTVHDQSYHIDRFGRKPYCRPLWLAISPNNKLEHPAIPLFEICLIHVPFSNTRDLKTAKRKLKRRKKYVFQVLIL